MATGLRPEQAHGSLRVSLGRFTTEKEIDKLKESLPELPDEKSTRFQKQYNLSAYDAELLTKDVSLSNYFEEAVKLTSELSPKQIANNIINKKIDPSTILPAKLVGEILKANKTTEINTEELNKIIENVLMENSGAVEDYKKGKETAIMFLLGQVMRQFKEKVDAEKIKAVLTAKLK